MVELLFCRAQTPHGSSNWYTFAGKQNGYLVAVLVSLLAVVLIYYEAIAGFFFPEI
jgi:hypothetical protein